VAIVAISIPALIIVQVQPWVRAILLGKSRLLSSLLLGRLSSLAGVSIFFLSFAEGIGLRGCTLSPTPHLSFIFTDSAHAGLTSGFTLLAASLRGGYFSSVESLWGAIAWQERELGEMLGVTILKKRDSRALFLSPLLHAAPLRKSFPTAGFYELLRSPLSESLAYVRL